MKNNTKTIKDIREELAIRLGVSKKQAKEIENTFRAIIKDYLMDEYNVIFYGVCKLELINLPERQRKNPKTGIFFTAPPRRTVKAKASDTLKELVK